MYAKYHRGTGRWLLECAEFERWLSGSNATVLWCPGNRKPPLLQSDHPSSSWLVALIDFGDSWRRKDCHDVCITQTIVSNLTDNRSLAVNHVQESVRGSKAAIAYVYCDYKDTATHFELELLASIARQLIEQTTSIPATATDFCNRNTGRRRNPTSDEWVSLIQSLCIFFPATYLFIDALVNVLPRA